MANERFYQGSYWDSLGISYSGGTFTIQDAIGRDLSTSNPAYLVLPSKSTPGIFVKYKVTASQNFIDDAGSSEIINNLFGFTTSVAISVDVPFFIYAVSNDAEDTIQFMISRHPHRKTSPVAANIGAPDDAVADAEGDFWSFDNIDETLYDENPCMCVGSFRMQMSASDDWTVQTLAATDGIGQFQEGVQFSQPLGQFGANASTITRNNGGTAPVFSTTTTIYFIEKSGYVIYEVFLSSDGGTDGAGAVTSQITTPFLSASASVNTNTGTLSYRAASGNLTFCYARINPTTNYFEIFVSGVSATGALTWGAFTNGVRDITGTMYYKLSGQ